MICMEVLTNNASQCTSLDMLFSLSGDPGASLTDEIAAYLDQQTGLVSKGKGHNVGPNSKVTASDNQRHQAWTADTQITEDDRLKKESSTENKDKIVTVARTPSMDLNSQSSAGDDASSIASPRKGLRRQVSC